MNRDRIRISPMAVQAIQKSLKTLFLTPDPYAASLRQALAEYYDVDEECIVIDNGSTEVMNALAISKADEGGGDVLASSPTFVLYSFIAKMHGFGFKAVPLKNYVHDVESLLKEAAAVGVVRAIFVDSPYHVSGTTIATTAVADLAASVPEAVVVLDNVYGEFQANDISGFMRQVARNNPNVLVCRSFSKVHALLGLRVGYGIGHPALIEKIRSKIVPYSVNAIAQAAAVASLRDVENVRRNLELNERAKRMSYRLLDELGIAYVPTENSALLINFGQSKARTVTELCDQHNIKYRGADKCGISHHVQVHLIDPETICPFLEVLRKTFGKGGGNA